MMDIKIETYPKESRKRKKNVEQYIKQFSSFCLTFIDQKVYHTYIANFHTTNIF